MDAASMRLWSSSSLWERRMRENSSKVCKRNSPEDSRSQRHLHKCQEGKKEEESWKRSKRKEKPAITAKWDLHRQVGAMKAFQLVVFLILLGFRVQMVKAVEQEISTHSAIEEDLCPALRAESRTGCKKIGLCERRCEEMKIDRRVTPKRNSQGEGPGHQARSGKVEGRKKKEKRKKEERRKKKEERRKKKEERRTKRKKRKT